MGASKLSEQLSSVASISAFRTFQLCSSISALRTSQLCCKHLCLLNSQNSSALIASISAFRTAQLCCKHLSSQNISTLFKHLSFQKQHSCRVNSRGIGTVSNFTTCRNGSPYSAYSSLFDSRPLFLSSLYSSLHPSLSLPDSRYVLVHVHLING